MSSQPANSTQPLIPTQQSNTHNPTLAEKTTNIAHSVVETASNMAHSISGTASNVAHNAAQAASSAAHVVAEKVQQALVMTKQTLGNAVEGTKEAIADVAQKVKQVYHQLTEETPQVKGKQYGGEGIFGQGDEDNQDIGQGGQNKQEESASNGNDKVSKEQQKIKDKSVQIVNKGQK